MNKNKAIFEEIRRNVAGIDLASRGDHYVCGPRNDDGKHEIVAFGTTTKELHRILHWLKERDVESVALESTSVYWIPITDLLEANGVEVVLADTKKVRMVSGRKSDVKDCQWLQKLHSCGLIQGAFRPPEEIVAIRTVLREKENLIAMRVQSIQQMQKSLDQMNIRVHHAVTDIDGKTGMTIISAIICGERDPVKLAKLRDRRCKQSEAEIAEHLRGTWRNEHLFNLEQAFKHLQFIDAQIENYDSKVKEMFKALKESMSDSDTSDRSPNRAERRREEKKLTKKEKINFAEKTILTQIMKFDLTSIPGIAYDAAAIIVSELGAVFDRFPSEKHFIAYLGLAPSLNKSAGKYTRYKRCVNTCRVKLILMMAASALYRSKTELGAYFDSVARRVDRKTAVKAVARRIAQMIYRGVKHGIEYIDKGAEAFLERNRVKAIKTAKHLIKLHNINVLELN